MLQLLRRRLGRSSWTLGSIASRRGWLLERWPKFPHHSLILSSLPFIASSAKLSPKAVPDACFRHPWLSDPDYLPFPPYLRYNNKGSIQAGGGRQGREYA